MHPLDNPRRPYIQTVLDQTQGPIVAVSDYMKIVPDQIAPWLPGRLLSLGTDGFGRSDNRTHLRRFFEIDAEFIVVAALHQLSQRGEIPATQVAKPIQELGINPEKADPMVS